MSNNADSGRSATVDTLYWAGLILLGSYLPIPMSQKLHISLPIAVLVTLVALEVLVFFRWGIGRLSKLGFIVLAFVVPVSAYCYLRIIHH